MPRLRVALSGEIRFMEGSAHGRHCGALQTYAIEQCAKAAVLVRSALEDRYLYPVEAGRPDVPSSLSCFRPTLVVHRNMHIPIFMVPSSRFSLPVTAPTLIAIW